MSPRLQDHSMSLLKPMSYADHIYNQTPDLGGALPLSHTIMLASINNPSKDPKCPKKNLTTYMYDTIVSPFE